MSYGPVFTLGMCYAIMLQDHLAVLFHWRNAWIAVIVASGALLATIAWTRYRGNALSRPSGQPERDRSPAADV
jgi:membrane protein implicated in regulation of membrane protease activity